MQDAAEFYASQGLQPVKILPKDKKPFEDGWQKKDYGTTEKAREAFQNFTGNVGVRGDENGVIGLDFDEEIFKIKMFQQLPMLRETLQSRGRKETGHCWIRLTTPLKNQSIRLHFEDRTKQTFADLRGIGGQIVVAPSIHPEGAKYQWLNNNPILTIDTDFFLDALDVACLAVGTKNPYRKEQSPLVFKPKNNVFQTIKDAVSIQQYLNTNEERVNCPVHKEQTPSQAMRLYPETKSCYCFSCGFAGDVIALNAKIKGLTPINSVKDLASRYGIEIEEEKAKDRMVGELTKTINSWFNFKDLAAKFVAKQPLYFDRARNWFLWDFENSKWAMVDETDVLIAVENALQNASITITVHTKNEIIDVLRRVGRQSQPKPPKETWVQFKNEIYDVLTGEKFEATPEYFITNPLPWRVGDSEETPTIDRLLKEWVVGGKQDETWIKTLEETLAYSMLSYQPLQKLFALNGAGNNGKGCYIKLIRKFIGKENYSDTELKLLINGRFESNKLYHKLAVFMTELQETDIKNTSLLKALSGEDEISYEFKGKDGFSDRSYATLIMATNSLPTTSDKTAGYYRRWLLIDFPNTFEVGRDVIGEIPTQEFENLARKLLRVAKELLERKTFTNEGSTHDKETRYEERSNPVGHFISENYEDEPDAYVLFSEFYNQLQDWLKKNNHRRLSNKAVGVLLRDSGYQIERKNEQIENEPNEAGYVKRDYKTMHVIYGIRFKKPLEKGS